MSSPVSLVVPIRRFDDAKSRLATVLSPADRRELAISCAREVVRSIPHADVFVICDDDEVAEFARALGATAVMVQAEGLNASLAAGLPRVIADRPDQPVVVAHADLPFGRRLGELWDDIGHELTAESVVIVPDDRLDGSNVVLIGIGLLPAWRFAYGVGSFEAHRSHARHLGVEPIVIVDELLSLDVDTPDDLENPRISRLLDRLITKRDNS